MVSLRIFGVMAMVGSILVLATLCRWPVQGVDSLAAINHCVVISSAVLIVGAVFTSIGMLGEKLDELIDALQRKD
jgi:hypothetical protein